MDKFIRLLFWCGFSFLFLLSFTIRDTFGEIVEINQSNIQSNLRKRKFLILYISSKASPQSRFLYPKYIAASQPYADDKDIIFGRVRNKKLIKEMGIETFPSIWYYGPKYKEPERYDGDITVDGITQLILDKAKNVNFVPHDKQYVVELDQYNFDQVTETPKQFKMVLLYKTEHTKEYEMIEELAKIFQYEDKIAFGRVHVDKQRKIAKKIQVYPALYWYKDDEKPVQARYGAGFDRLVLLEFLNDQTGNKFDIDGSLNEMSGRIPELDKIISENIGSIRESRNMKYVVNNARRAADFHRNKEYADYYVYLLEEILNSKSLDVISVERTDIVVEMSAVQSERKRAVLKKKQNIINFIVDEIGKDFLGKDFKDSPFVQKSKDNTKWEPKEQTDKINVDDVADEDEEEKKDDKDKRKESDKTEGKGKRKKDSKKKKAKKVEHMHTHEEL